MSSRQKILKKKFEKFLNKYLEIHDIGLKKLKEIKDYSLKGPLKNYFRTHNYCLNSPKIAKSTTIAIISMDMVPRVLEEILKMYYFGLVKDIKKIVE